MTVIVHRFPAHRSCRLTDRAVQVMVVSATDLESDGIASLLAAASLEDDGFPPLAGVGGSCGRGLPFALTARFRVSSAWPCPRWAETGGFQFPGWLSILATDDVAWERPWCVWLSRPPRRLGLQTWAWKRLRRGGQPEPSGQGSPD
jgi:hypothetical protein